MTKNSTIKAMLKRKSIRKYTDQMPSDEVIDTIVRAGQQAPFASQFCSLLLTRGGKDIPYEAPLSFIFCVDAHKLELIMARRGWKMITNDLFIMLLGIQDATLVGENMVMAAETLGLGSCYIGDTPYLANKFAKDFKLPKRVFPLVELVMGYPAEDPPTRPRYPKEFFLFENEYPQFSEEQIDEAMKVMDEGYLAQDYYRNPDIMINLMRGKKETFDHDTYSWTEHISRKWGQWNQLPKPLHLQFEKRGFKL